jgi:hypothetical protein
MMQEEELFQLKDAPNDVISLIFSFCSPYYLIQSASKVCKQWYICMKQPFIWKNEKVYLDTKSHEFSSLVMQFWKDCQINKFVFSNAKQVNSILAEFFTTVKSIELDWNISGEEVAQINFEPACDFNALECMIFHDQQTKIVQKWLPFMTNLTELDGHLTCIDSIKTNKLKKLNIWSDVSEHSILKLFQHQPLEHLTVTLNEAVSPKVWNQILGIPEVLNRMKYLYVRQYITESNTLPFNQPSYIPSFKNLKTLYLEDCWNILFFAAQNTVEELSLSIDIPEFASISLPHVKILHISRCRIQTIATLINACSSTLEFLDISDVKRSDPAPSLNLKLPLLNSLYIYGCPLSLVCALLEGSTDSKFKSISFTDIDFSDTDVSVLSELAPLFSRVSISNDYNGPPELFMLLAPECILDIHTIDFGTSTYTSFTNLSEDIFQRILMCQELTLLQCTDITSVSANNWIPRLLNSCPRLTCINLPNARLEAEMDLSTLTEHYISALSLHASNLKLDQIQYLSNLKQYSLTLDHIQHQEFSDTIVQINELEGINSIDLNVDHDCSDKVQECVLLKNFQIVNFTVSGSNINYEDFLLEVICTSYESKNQIALYCAVSEAKGFLPYPYNIYKGEPEEYLEILREVTKIVLPDVVKRVKDISEEKRQTILNELLTAYDTHPIFQRVYDVIPHCLPTIQYNDGSVVCSVQSE